MTTSATQPSLSSCPCGISLEYDPDYLLLLGRLAPRTDVQYGDFVGQPAAADWADIERQALQLLSRSQDVALLVCLCRTATRLRHAAGLAQALSQLLAALRGWPEALHPQIVVDGVRDPGVRANALAALADRHGLAGDVGDLMLTLPPAGSCRIRELEAALAQPRRPGAAPAEAVRAQLAARRLEECRDPAQIGTLMHLEQAAVALVEIELCAREQLGDDAPSLQALAGLLRPFLPSTSVAQAAVPPAIAACPPAPPPATERTRADLRAVLADARLWFEQHEPSSPVSLLLQHAESLIGQAFCQVVQAVPAELLQRWQISAQADRQAAR